MNSHALHDVVLQLLIFVVKTAPFDESTINRVSCRRHHLLQHGLAVWTGKKRTVFDGSGPVSDLEHLQFQSVVPL